MKRLGLSTLLLAIVVCSGWTFVVVKDAVAVVGVLPFLGRAICHRRRPRRPVRSTSQAMAVLCHRGLDRRRPAAAYLLQTLGLHSSTATNTGLITGLFIVFAPLANRLLFGVPTSGVLWAAIAVSLCGLGLLTGAGPQGLQPGDPLTLGCAACLGCTSRCWIATRKATAP